MIKLHDKHFEPMLKNELIEIEIQRMATQISQDYAGKTPLFIAILNGSFMFAAQLMKSLTIPAEITFLRVSSYQATSSTGKVLELLGLQESVENREVIVLEDIIDTGLTMEKIKEQLLAKNPSSFALASLFHKPEALKTPIEIDYLGFKIENKFVVGYGLDYDGLGRNLSDLYVLKEG